jgi:hypothetical protein
MSDSDLTLAKLIETRNKLVTDEPLLRVVNVTKHVTAGKPIKMPVLDSSRLGLRYPEPSKAEQLIKKQEYYDLFINDIDWLSLQRMLFQTPHLYDVLKTIKIVYLDEQQKEK